MNKSLAVVAVVAVVAATFALNREFAALQSIPGNGDRTARRVAANNPEKPKGTQPAIGEIVPPAQRNVTPDSFTPGPDVSGPLVRIQGNKPPPPKPRYKRFFQVLVVSAGSLRTSHTQLRLAGVSGPPVDELCDGARTGAKWPCGRRARAELRRLIRGRAIDCHVESQSVPARLTTDCRVGTTDLALWLVTQGWARINQTAADNLVGAMSQAKAARRGLWRQPPRD
jgi:endonuclease YncB( thermonuclease family)